MKVIDINEMDGYGDPPARKFTKEQCSKGGKRGGGKSGYFTTERCRELQKLAIESRMRNVEKLREKVNRQLLGYPEEKKVGELDDGPRIDQLLHGRPG